MSWHSQLTSIQRSSNRIVSAHHHHKIENYPSIEMARNLSVAGKVVGPVGYGMLGEFHRSINY